MIYLHCKFYNVIKINYGGPDTGHVRPAGRSLETPALIERTSAALTLAPPHRTGLWHYATSRSAAGSIPDGVIAFSN
jgi:hypothetical protein